jgi:[ribosomal protein S18]-alanine N-acetyltransferase
LIRRATAADVAQIAALELTAGGHSWTSTGVAGTLASNVNQGWLFDGVGHVLASSVAAEGEILTICVHPDARRRGIGESLMLATLEWWRAEGVLHGFLEVRVNNEAAIGLYRKLGFESVGRRPRYYTDGTDALVMQWSG